MELFTKSRQFFQTGLQIDVDAWLGFFLSYLSMLVASPSWSQVQVGRKAKEQIFENQTQNLAGFRSSLSKEGPRTPEARMLLDR